MPLIGRLRDYIWKKLSARISAQELAQLSADINSEAWERTPSWHPRRWLGAHYRRWVWDQLLISGYYEGQWQYATEIDVAKSYLDETFNTEREK